MPTTSNEVPSRVWYASYGSNMDAIRFSHYIVGGTPKGASRDYKGCDDKTPPAEDALMELPHQLFFAGESRVWTGGMAFIGNSLSQERTKSRAYLITSGQFEQIAAQESARDEVRPLDISLLRSLGRLTIGDGTRNYDEMLYCGEKDGLPIITFTSPSQDRPYTKPAAQYLKTIASGLRSSHGLSDDEICDYLIAKPGIAGNYSKTELITTIE